MKLLSLVPLMALAFAHNTFASESVNANDGNGFWVSGQLGQSYVDPGDFQSNIKSNSFSGAVSFGYDFNKTLGVYSQYNYIQSIANDNSLDMAIVGTQLNYYFSNTISSFFKIGIAHADNNWTGTGGIGVEYHPTNSISTFIGYDYFQNSNLDDFNSDISQVYWGMKYKFGQVENEPKSKTIYKEVIKQTNIPFLTRSSFLLGFSTGSHDLNSSSKYTLNELITILKQYPSLKVGVASRTDRTGNENINTIVSNDRALATANYLISNGIEKNRIKIRSLKNDKPLSKDSPVKSQLERSVNVVLLK